MKHTLRTHIPVSFLLLTTSSITILYLVYQIRLTGDSGEALSIDTANKSVGRLLTKCNAADARLNASDTIAWHLIMYSLRMVAIVGVSIDNIDDHEIVIHLIKDRLLVVIANLCVVAATAPSEHTLDACARHLLRPLHRTDETVVHSIAGVRIVSLHAHNV